MTVFEPNLFNLLLVGNTEEQRVLADGDIFFKHMIAAASAEDWDTSAGLMENGMLWKKEQRRCLCTQLLADLRCKKKMVISAVPGIGSKDSLMALAKLLRKEAGFEIIRAPVSDHMGLIGIQNCLCYCLNKS